jgi:hypothetical protein
LKAPSYGEPGVDVMYGIRKDWLLYRWLQLRTEFLISNSSTVLKDRSVQSGSDFSSVMDSFPHLPAEGTGYTNIRYFDIDIQLRYLEIPLLLKAEKSLRRNLSIGLEIGYSLKLFPKDGSKATFLREAKSSDLTEEERQNFRFDYRTTTNNENYSYYGGGICPTIGTYVNYSRFHLGLRYQVDYIDWVSGIVIGEDIPLHIFSFSMGYRF